MFTFQDTSPIYLQLATVLRDRIRTREWYTPLLPPEQELAVEFSVGRDTVRDALAVLRGEGLIEARRGFRACVRVPETHRTRPAQPA